MNACIRCGGTEDLMDRGMAPGMTYCAPCRRLMAEGPLDPVEEQVEIDCPACGWPFHLEHSEEAGDWTAVEVSGKVHRCRDGMRWKTGEAP